jgi:hypothetical protein
MKSFWKFKFIVENGSHSEIGILGCDITSPKLSFIANDNNPIGVGLAPGETIHFGSLDITRLSPSPLHRCRRTLWHSKPSWRSRWELWHPSQGWSFSLSNNKRIRRSSKRRSMLGRSIPSCRRLNVMTSLPTSKQPSTPSWLNYIDASPHWGWSEPLRSTSPKLELGPRALPPQAHLTPFYCCGYGNHPLALQVLS